MPTNNHEPEYLLRELRAHARLSDEKRSRMRAELSALADFHAPLREAAPAPVAGFWAWASLHRYSAPGIGLLVLALMAGTSYASEDALPGEPLYMMKVRVTEPIELVLKPTTEGKAAVHVELAERRLSEAAKLAVENTLDPDTSGFLEKEFSAHVDESLAAADKLEAKGKADAALDIRSGLESSLVAHADILDLVEDHLDETGNEYARASTQKLLDAVKLRQEVVSETRLALENDVAETATPTKTLALVTKTDAVVPQVTARAEAVSEPAADHIQDAATALTAAKESLERNDPGETSLAFKKAHEAEIATEAATIILENADVLTAIGKATTTPSGTTTPVTATTTPATTTPATPAR